MALELVGGAILGVVFEQLRNEILRVKDNVAMFKPKLEELEETLEALSPVIQEIEELNRRLNRPNHGRETIILRRLLEDGAKLVCKCSKLPRWDFLKQSRYREKLMELNNKIMKFTILMQAHLGRDQKQTLLFMQEMRQMVIMLLNQQGFPNLPRGLTASSSTDSSDLTMGLTGFSGADLTVGLTASSTDSSYMVKMVFKVNMQSQRCRNKALKVVASSDGVNFVGIEGEDKARVVVVGKGVDAVSLALRLRKTVGQTNILSMADIK